MLYLVNMELDPKKGDPEAVAELAKKETEVSLDYQREGVVLNIWRVVGRYANFSVYDVDSNDELHRRLTSLPLYPYMDIRITPLAVHPSSLEAHGETR